MTRTASSSPPAPARTSRSRRGRHPPRGEEAGTEHHQEAEEADDREAPPDVDPYDETADEHHEADDEDRHRLQATTTTRLAQPTTLDTGRKLGGVFRVQSALDLFEHALLVLRKWHRPSFSLIRDADDGQPRPVGRLRLILP